MVDTPDKEMMSHGLRPKLALAGRRFSLQGESAAGADAKVIVEMRIQSDEVAQFIGGHAVVLEGVVDNIDAQTRLFIDKALMSSAGIVNLIEIAVFDCYVFAVLPDLNTVSEADPLPTKRKSQFLMETLLTLDWP